MLDGRLEGSSIGTSTVAAGQRRRTYKVRRASKAAAERMLSNRSNVSVSGSTRSSGGSSTFCGVRPSVRMSIRSEEMKLVVECSRKSSTAGKRNQQ